MIFAARFVCACVHACVRAYVQIADEETRRAQWCHPSCSLLPFLPPFLLVTRDSLSLAFPIYARSCLFTLAHWYTLYSPLDSPSPQSSLFGVPFHSWCLAADIIYMTNVADLRRKRRSRASSASRACAWFWREIFSSVCKIAFAEISKWRFPFGDRVREICRKNWELYCKLWRNCDELNEK